MTHGKWNFLTEMYNRFGCVNCIKDEISTSDGEAGQEELFQDFNYIPLRAEWPYSVALD